MSSASNHCGSALFHHNQTDTVGLACWIWKGQTVIMLGGLHLELTILKLIGDWVEDNGWTEALVQVQMAQEQSRNS